MKHINFTDESVKGQIPHSISENLTNSDLESKKIAEFGINLFILENWKRLNYRESFSWKMIRDLLESYHKITKSLCKHHV